MTHLRIHNSQTVVESANEAALTIVEDVCTLQYEYFYRRRGMARAKREVRDLKYFHPGYGTFPTGWVGKVCRNLKRHSISFSVDDQRIKPKKIDLRIEALPNAPWEHQNEALVAIQEAERGIIQVPTRGGKTLIMALALAYFNVPTVVIVPNKTLLEQEYEVFSEVFGEEKVGRLGGGHLDYEKDIIVSTTQTLYSRIDDFFTELQVFRKRGCVLFDECHHISHGGYKLRNTYFEVAQRCEAAYYRIGFTATPGSTMSLERQLLVAAAGRLIYSVDIEELTSRSILTQGSVHMVAVDIPHTKTLREILEEDHGIVCPPGSNHEKLFRDNQLPIPQIPSFHEQLREKVTDATAFQALVRLLAEHHSAKGRSVLVLVSLVERGVRVFTEGRYAITGAKGLSGESPDRTACLDEFRDGRFPVLVSTLIREGVDLPRADVLLMAHPDVQNATPTLQRAGRVLTHYEGKKVATIIDFYLKDGGILERHSRERLRLYEQNGFNIEILSIEDIEKMK